MKFRKFKQNKLWRDKLIEEIQKSGSILHIKKLNDQEFAAELKVKFMEEAHEVDKATSKDELMGELADILEVMRTLGIVNAFTLQDVIDLQNKKYHERGGFEGRNFITIAEHPVGSSSVGYCLADPEKYPEIVD